MVGNKWYSAVIFEACSSRNSWDWIWSDSSPGPLTVASALFSPPPPWAFWAAVLLAVDRPRRRDCREPPCTLAPETSCCMRLSCRSAREARAALRDCVRRSDSAIRVFSLWEMESRWTVVEGDVTAVAEVD